MAYLLDSNTFIDAGKRYYAQDLCPGFWDWLHTAHQDGRVLTLDKIKEELMAKEDEISQWVQEAPNSYFVELDEATMSSLSQVSLWVTGQDYKDSAVASFLSKADYFLIGYALAHGHQLVTLEQHTSGRSKVKIPTVCRALGVQTIDAFQMLRNEGAKFFIQP